MGSQPTWAAWIEIYANSIGAFLLKEVVKLIDFILGYVTGMVITVLTLIFFMGANQDRGDY